MPKERHHQKRECPHPYRDKHYRPRPTNTLFVPRPYHDQPDEKNRQTGDTEIASRFENQPVAAIKPGEPNPVMLGYDTRPKLWNEASQRDGKEHARYEDGIDAGSHVRPPKEHAFQYHSYAKRPKPVTQILRPLSPSRSKEISTSRSRTSRGNFSPHSTSKTLPFSARMSSRPSVSS